MNMIIRQSSLIIYHPYFQINATGHNQAVNSVKDKSKSKDSK